MSNFNYNNRQVSGLAQQLAEFRSRGQAQYTRDLMREYREKEENEIQALNARLDANSRENKITTLATLGLDTAKFGYKFMKKKKKSKIPTAEEAGEDEDIKFKGTKVDMDKGGTRVNLENKGGTRVRDLNELELPEPVQAVEQDPNIGTFQTPVEPESKFDDPPPSVETEGELPKIDDELSKADQDFLESEFDPNQPTFDPSTDEQFHDFLAKQYVPEEEFNPYANLPTGEAPRLKMASQKSIFGDEPNTEYLDDDRGFFKSMQDSVKDYLNTTKKQVQEGVESVQKAFDAKDPIEELEEQRQRVINENQYISDATKRERLQNKPDYDDIGEDWQLIDKEPKIDDEEYEDPQNLKGEAKISEDINEPLPESFGKVQPDDPTFLSGGKGGFREEDLQDLQDVPEIPNSFGHTSYEQSLIDMDQRGEMRPMGSQEYEDWKQISGIKEPSEPVNIPVEQPETINKGGYDIPKFEPEEDAKSEFSEAAQQSLKRSSTKVETEGAEDFENIEDPAETGGIETAELAGETGAEVGLEEGGAALDATGIGAIVGVPLQIAGAGLMAYSGVSYLKSHKNFFPAIGHDVKQIGNIFTGNPVKFQNPFEDTDTPAPHRVQMAIQPNNRDNEAGAFVGAGVTGQQQY